jgi:hypothetical protein
MNFKNMLVFALLGLVLLSSIGFAGKANGETISNEDTIILYYGTVGAGSATNPNCSAQYTGLAYNTVNVTVTGNLAGMVEFYQTLANGSKSGTSNGTKVIICKNMSSFVDYGWALPRMAEINLTGSAWSSGTGFSVMGNESNTLIYSIVATSPVFNMTANNTNITNFSFRGAAVAAGIVVNGTNVRIQNNFFNSTLVGVQLENESHNITIYDNKFYLAGGPTSNGIGLNRGSEATTSLIGFRGMNITNNSFNGSLLLGTAINGHRFYNPIIVNNTIKNVNVGILLNYTQLGGNLSTNIISNATIALYMTDTNRTNVSLGSISRSGVGGIVTASIYLANASDNNFSSFTLEGNDTSLYGIYLLDAAQNNTFYNLTIYNLSAGGGGFGIYGLRNVGQPFNNTVKNCNITRVTAALQLTTTDWKIHNNTIFNVWQAINVTTARNMTIADNYMYNCSNGTAYACVRLVGAASEAGNTVYNNRIDNSSVSFEISAVTNSHHLGTFWNNTVIRASLVGIRVTDYLFNFSGNNFIYNTSATGTDVYVNGSGNFSTGNYNLTTEHITFAVTNLTNLSVKSVNLTALGYSTTLTSVGNTSSTTDQKHLMATTSGSNYYGLNVSNLSSSASAKMDLTFYYLSSEIGVGDVASFGSNTTTNSWTAFYPNRWTQTWGNTALSIYSANLTVPYTGTSTLLTPIKYRYQAAGGSATTSSTTSKSTVSLSKTFDCATGKLVVTVESGGAVSGLTVKLFNTADYSVVSGTSNSEGKVTFTISKTGTYQLEAEATTAYLATSISDFGLTLCPATTETPEVTTPVTTPETTTPEVIVPETTPTTTPETVPEVTTPSITKEEVLVIISSADSAIVLAVKENKDVSGAKAKLTEANVLIASGDLEGAKKLAEEALALVKSAKAKATTPATTAPTTKPATPQQGMDLGTILLIGAVVVIVIVGIYYFTRSKGSGYKGQKGQRRF